VLTADNIQSINDHVQMPARGRSGSMGRGETMCRGEAGPSQGRSIAIVYHSHIWHVYKLVSHRVRSQFEKVGAWLNALPARAGAWPGPCLVRCGKRLLQALLRGPPIGLFIVSTKLLRCGPTHLGVQLGSIPQLHDSIHWRIHSLELFRVY
jgi:hypothetical protein